MWLFKSEFSSLRKRLGQSDYKHNKLLATDVKTAVKKMALLLGAYTRAQAAKVQGYTINGTVLAREAIIHVALNREFKLVCLKSQLDHEALQRELKLSQEAHAAFHCSSLIKYDQEETMRGHLMLVSDFYPRSLQDFLMKMDAPLMTSAVIHIFFSVLAALRVLHALEFAHCDVHAGNIMLSSQQSVILIDLGSAAAFDSPAGDSALGNDLNLKAGAPLDLSCLARTVYVMLGGNPTLPIVDLLKLANDRSQVVVFLLS
jgi:serine/threonine protein kinase